ncbi:MAG: alpha-galactosidase [Planctomycetia bacterium]|nr:alpha-galactosidase [Planctomycetia bacterium]
MKKLLTGFSFACFFSFFLLLSELTPAQEFFPSFQYEGKEASINSFKQEKIEQKDLPHFVLLKTFYTAPDGKLRLEITRKIHKNFPVREYSVRLTNCSKTESTGIVENFRSLDFKPNLPVKNSSAVLNIIHGSQNKADDFIPAAVPLPSGKKEIFKTDCGRSSNDWIPFIELNFNDSEGWVFAIGWTGSWIAEFENNGSAVHVSAGTIASHFKLLPGESIIQPSITIFKRSGLNRLAFKTTVHRFMKERKAPRDIQGRILPPLRAITAGGGNKTPKMMLDVLQYKIDNDLPFNTYWVDAGWYGTPHEDEHYRNCGPNWSKYVGDWQVNTKTHPTGDLLPISNAVHKANMKFLLWFEPERRGSFWIKKNENPEYWNRSLLNLGNPDALKWIQNIVYGMIEKHSIDVYREDFNMQPGPVWAELDKMNPDRVGIAEAKHIAGLYTFLDEMRKKFPNIIQENCASGGRRIDIEMISRAHTYCRSDYPIGRRPGDTAFTFSQNATLNTLAYLPFQGSDANGVLPFDDYAMMSVVSSGYVWTPSDVDGAIVKRKFSDQETAWFKKVFKTAARMSDYYMGDFYPLTEETSVADDLWCGWQLDQPDHKEGFAIVFRRANAPEGSRTFALSNIDSGAKYEIEFFDGSKKTVSGSDLASWNVQIPKRSFKLIFYKKKNQ